ncbi:TolC family protein [Alkanindiges sp. WGS2144]|uniref:TolC family protein n=1 Tax=Alkanindiges sp. WGS2144 TaxID=3366808 RepID=UPI00375222FA
MPVWATQPEPLASLQRSTLNSPLTSQPDSAATPALNDALSFSDAAQWLEQNAYTLQASRASMSASQNDAQAMAQLWRPVVSLNANAIRYRTEVDVPLNNIKASASTAANQAFQQSLNSLPVPLPDNINEFLGDRFSSSVAGLLDQVPDSGNVVINEKLFGPTISAVMPLYTGGSIQAVQNIAQINAQKAQLGYEQASNQQLLKLVEAYFGQQLAVYLENIAQQNLNGLQQHLYNATQLEQQGMISRSQRLQVEVAVQAAQRQYNQASSNANTSAVYLQQLLAQPVMPHLSTPLFIVNTPLPPLEVFLNQLAQSPQLAQLGKDQQIAKEGARVAKAALLPSAYAFGQQTLDKNDWLVGLGARYTLMANTDRKKQLNAAKSRVEAIHALQLQAAQDLQQLVIRAYNETETARKAFLSMQTSINAAQENLRVQQLSFREGETTATFVNDALTALNLAYTDQATAAYRYDLALATLLATTGQAEQFIQYLVHPSLMSVRHNMTSGLTNNE